MRHAMNPERFRSLQSEVAEKASEKAQVNAVVAALSAMGYRKAASPEVSQTSVDRSTYRIYLWRETPFGDHVVLATGPEDCLEKARRIYQDLNLLNKAAECQ